MSRNFLAFEKLVQYLVVVFGDGFDQLGAERLSFLLQFSRDLFSHVLGTQSLIFPDDRFHREQIDNTFELVFLSDGNLNRDRFGIEALADGIDGMLKLGAHFVNLVDETNSW